LMKGKNGKRAEKLDISHLRLPPVVAAPMAGVTDYPFRLVLRDFFNGLAFTEMLSAEAVSRQNPRTMQMAKLDGGITGVQLVGSEPKTVAKAAIIAEGWNPSVIDINAGCPDPHVMKKGGGAALMKNPVLARKIVEAVVEAVDVPVTVKIRSGWGEVILKELSEEVLASGAKAVTLHPRLARENYRTPADQMRTKRFVELIDHQMPVIVSGDVKSEEIAVELLEKTGAQAVMPARWMRGDPELPLRMQKALEGKQRKSPTPVEKCRWLLIHARHAVDYFGEEPGMKRMRKHTFWYLKGIPRRSVPSNRVNKMMSVKELEEICRQVLSNLGERT